MSVAMVGAAAAIGGAYISSQGAKSAANTQAGAANAATQSQREMFEKTAANNAPYNQAGQQATSKLADLLGISGIQSPASKSQDNFDANAYLAANPDVAADSYFGTHPWEHYQQYGQGENRAYTSLAPAAGTGTASADYGSLTKPFSMSDFQLDPGIQFQTQQGNQALMNSQAAKNGTLSGGALKDLIAFNQGMAGTGYQSAFDRYMTGKQFTLGSMMGVAGLGQNAAANTGNNSATVSNGIAGTITGAGNAGAAGQVGSANAMTSGINGAANSYTLSRLLNNGSTNADIGGPVTTSANPNGIYSAA